VSAALRNGPGAKLSRLPRMADFAIWVTAAEPALRWPGATFLDAYGENRDYPQTRRNIVRLGRHPEDVVRGETW